MRNIIIQRITEIFLQFPDLQFDFDVTPDRLQELSNAELVDLFEDVIIDLHDGLDEYVG